VDGVDRGAIDAPALPARHDTLRQPLIGRADGIECHVGANTTSQQGVNDTIETMLDPGPEHDHIPNARRKMLEGGRAP
jgi:hypothetical protein